MQLQTKDTAERFKVLAAGARLAIIELLKQGPRKVSEICEALGASQPAVSQHLKILKAAGLVSDEKDGYWVSYSLNTAQLLEYKLDLNGVCRCSRESESQSLPERALLEVYKEELERELEEVKHQLKQSKG
ncbi:winged helix-turn-helix transcriptional regulator [Candidatus Acetothermia bacterium]|nr:winged helix-turn-helix transcriptional regulator [Candidatus Acetothermia bacterium]MBI3643876.1 winged helix-turn-helix transcriptional regulator [Candidatus Acetothermia bacterium]